MNDEFHSDEPEATDGPNNGPNNGPSGPQSQEIRHSQISALVPEHVAAGTFSTGAVVLNGNHEFIIDFLLRMQQPQQVAARVILPPTVIPQLIAALQENLRKYEARFGPPPTPPAPIGQPTQAQSQPSSQTSAQDLYDQLKIPDTVMAGDYANAVMIGHTATEFSFDFITTFFPRSSVARRVYLAAPNVPRLLDSLQHSYKQFQQRRTDKPPGPTPDASPE
jgi:hypothetical protein